MVATPDLSGVAGDRFASTPKTRAWQTVNGPARALLSPDERGAEQFRGVSAGRHSPFDRSALATRLHPGRAGADFHRSPDLGAFQPGDRSLFRPNLRQRRVNHRCKPSAVSPVVTRHCNFAGRAWNATVPTAGVHSVQRRPTGKVHCKETWWSLCRARVADTDCTVAPANARRFGF